ncbi:ABC transporter permease [Nitratireductor mangrovi]|uniref:Nickel/cobalt efflux system n=1 Tax=Nitratireductor mangrovi TaxID=2599600 RepID=A0A5B8L6A8_9HYPH|nr:ABC transporter permease [Nitratireductor mangrovi]QDZ03491.2 ABC transporter permease [Nitratireductor mangrovi]
MMWLFQDLIAIQREIYLAFGERIRAFADSGDWSLLAFHLPMGILFGAVHALTPGHSKAVLAAYLTGSTARVPRALGISLILSTVHVGMSVFIALLSLPLVSVALGSVGRAPLLENLSRGLLGAIGVWMLWQAARGTGHAHRRDTAAGFAAGLIPCPLTLFVMTFAISRGVPEAGVAFAVVMLGGVAFVLAAVAVAAVIFRQSLLQLLASRPSLLDRTTRSIQLVVGIILVVVAANTLVG